MFCSETSVLLILWLSWLLLSSFLWLSCLSLFLLPIGLFITSFGIPMCQASACTCMPTQQIPSRRLLTCIPCLLFLSLRPLASPACLGKHSGLFCCAQALRSLVSNDAVQLEPYLHQIMPFILTCMVGKRLGVSFTAGVTLSKQLLNTHLLSRLSCRCHISCCYSDDRSLMCSAASAWPQSRTTLLSGAVAEFTGLPSAV